MALWVSQTPVRAHTRYDQGYVFRGRCTAELKYVQCHVRYVAVIAALTSGVITGPYFR